VGTAVAQWLMYCTTNQNVVGSIPPGVHCCTGTCKYARYLTNKVAFLLTLQLSKCVYMCIIILNG
jgi:hypothetical protein